MADAAMHIERRYMEAIRSQPGAARAPAGPEVKACATIPSVAQAVKQLRRSATQAWNLIEPHLLLRPPSLPAGGPILI